MSKRKVRPSPGDPFVAGMSERDVAALGILSRREVQTALAVASIPKDEFERLMEAEAPPSITALVDLARGRATRMRKRLSLCPHCGQKL